MEKLNNYLIRCHNINTTSPYYDFKVAVTKRYIKQYANLGTRLSVESYISALNKIIENESEREKERLMKYLSEEYKEYFPKMEINRKSMIKLLELRDYATKEDILNELKEIL